MLKQPGLNSAWGKFYPKKVIQKSYPQIIDVKNTIQKSYPKIFIELNATLYHTNDAISQAE